MKPNPRRFWIFLWLTGLLSGAGLASLADKPPTVPGHSALVLTIHGAIGPATSDYVIRHLKEAPSRGAALVVLEVDTPGGLDLAMRDIVQAIIQSPIPVATYVSPSGARAASAGTYILFASHIAAMAPGTNLGAATPVQIGGFSLPPAKLQAEAAPESPPQPAPANPESIEITFTEPAAPERQGDPMQHKLINDAEAYIRALAQLHHRNADWAAKAVREADSLPALDALANNVVDLVTPSLTTLLQAVDGKMVQVRGQPMTLHTQSLTVERQQPDWRNQLLAVLTDPNIAYMLLLLGMYGLFFELTNPGAILPGVLGGVSILLALFALQLLPVNYAGLALLLLGVAFLVAEAFVPSFGALGIGGLVAFVMGSVILYDTELPEYQISKAIIAAFALIGVALVAWIATNLAAVRNRPQVTGKHALIGMEGVCVQASPNGGWLIRVHGELWQAHAKQTLVPGQVIVVRDVQGLVLRVE